jgi:hypothetical protein
MRLIIIIAIALGCSVTALGGTVAAFTDARTVRADR